MTGDRRRDRVAAAARLLRPVALGAGVAATVETAIRSDATVPEAALYGAVLAVGYLAWSRLAARLGGATALAAVCAGTAAALGLVGAAGAATGGLCRGCAAAPTTGYLILLGATLPLVVAATVGPVIFVARRLPGWVRAAWDRLDR